MESILVVQGWIMIALETSVVGILLWEFFYDKWHNELAEMRKKRKRRIEYEYLCQGESK